MTTTNLPFSERGSRFSALDSALVVGATGGVGQALVQGLAAASVQIVPTARRPIPGYVLLDLAGDLAGFDPPEVDVAFICAANASIQQCATDPAGTAAVNVTGTIALARHLAARGIFIVFCSTNQAFDGSRPFERADAVPTPRTEYGRQKVRAEQALLDLSADVAIVRLTKIIGNAWPVPAGWAMSLAAGSPARPFTGMPVAPISMDRAVAGLLHVGRDHLTGISQLSANADVTYPEIARSLAIRLGVAPGIILPGPPDPPLEHVPAHATLDSSRLDTILGPAPDPWDAITPVLDRLQVAWTTHRA